MRLEEGGEREKEGDSWGGVQGKERRRREEKMQRKECERERQMPPVRPQGGGGGAGEVEDRGERCPVRVRQAGVERGLPQGEARRKGSTVSASSSWRFLMGHPARAGVGQTPRGRGLGAPEGFADEHLSWCPPLSGVTAQATDDPLAQLWPRPRSWSTLGVLQVHPGSGLLSTEAPLVSP